MATALQNGALQVVYKNKNDGKFVLHETNLNTILQGVQDKELAIISVAGAYRKGKSFLLNFCLRYLQHTAQANGGDWLGDEPIAGFHWKNGSTRDTEGIFMWSKPFVIRRPCGGEMAVLLMDTQGVFDCNDTKEEATTIFALSLLTSSIQIYNVHSQIGSDCLEHFQFFTEYARMVQNVSNHRQAPSEKLIFLVRDWQWPFEYPYGPEGGKKLLEKTLKASNDDPEEVRELKVGVSSSRKLSCFLLPHPGKKVATQEQFQGKILDIDEEFIQHIKEFVSSELTPGATPVKEICGTAVKGKEFLELFKAYVNIFQRGDLPKPLSIIQANLHWTLANASKEAVCLYEQKMSEVEKSPKYLNNDEFPRVHAKHLKEALKLFTDRWKMGDSDTYEKSYKQLETDLNNRQGKFAAANDKKRPKYEMVAVGGGGAALAGSGLALAAGIKIAKLALAVAAFGLTGGAGLAFVGLGYLIWSVREMYRSRPMSTEKKDK